MNSHFNKFRRVSVVPALDIPAAVTNFLSAPKILICSAAQYRRSCCHRTFRKLLIYLLCNLSAMSLQRRGYFYEFKCT